MKITPKINKFQQGGEMQQAAPGWAPQEQAAQQDPMAQLLQAAAQALQSQDCQMALKVCEAFVQLAQSTAQQQESQGQPVYRKGGILSKRI